ncbi:MAG: single-stranded-DNA-specific exonuclease RecJ [Candidatus Nomurabacteria bacterium]|nr:MAG: single-stranded-DNA-specific exonuclease RecJ [Candidatus Nomurabacteria bacterium]
MTLFTVKEAILDNELGDLGVSDKTLGQLLYNRDLKTKDEVEKFLNPSYDEHLHDPFLLHDMEKAVARILRAIADDEKVVIYSDYDCDGIPGGVVLHDFFKAIGFENFSNYIPHRHYDGFGLSEKAVLSINKDSDPALIITIDCGTTDFEAVRVAKEQGIDVIITDHHEPKEKLPEAVAVVNPKIGNTYPFTGLCGAAVMYKLVQALIARGNFEINVGQEKWWLDMVGVATIADMVPLRGENRVLAHYGLRVLRKTRRPGLQKLLRKQKVDPRYLSEDDIGFTIGPRINAASRMDTPEDAFTLLSTTDEGEAEARMLHLEKLNTERKTAVSQMTKELHKRLELLEEIPAVFAMGNPNWRPSLVGLSANKLAEEYKRPVFLWGKDGNGMFKGSCRSGGEVSVVKLMEAVPEIFYEFGGHHASGGFTVREEKIHFFTEALQKAHEALGTEAVVHEPLSVDMEITLDMINNQLLKAQRACAPFGADNAKPLYLISNVKPEEVTVFGKAKDHTKLTFETTGLAKEAIAFFKLPENFTVTPTTAKAVSILAHLEESFFMGRMQIRLRVIDVI